MIKYTKGSEWRKWDLHVHTSASFHWNGGKKLRNMSSSEKEEDFFKLYNTITNSDVAVFCLMDYWSFEGYIQFKQFLNSKQLELNKTIFPGMELRIEAPVDYRLNIHVILSDTLTVQQLNDFKSKLLIRSINRQLSDEAICEFAKSLDKDKARKHGFNDPETLNEDDLLLLGASTMEVTKESLSDAMKGLPHNCGFILLPFDTSDGLKNLDWVTHPHADNYFMQSAHVFESRDEDTIKLFLGEENEKNKQYIGNFQKTLGKPKPVICGSDAHKYSDYGIFPNNKITWIKADPTFEGFKQIFLEPKQRVKIQQNIPEDKTPYLVIDKVRFHDKTNEKKFDHNWIEINPNLNVIIGGKSSGKSLLLYHIAKTISPQVILEGIGGHKYEFGSTNEFDFEVLWKDNELNRLSDDHDQKNRKITYIPQMYINLLAERQGNKNFIELINSVLEQNEEFKSYVDTIRSNIQEYELQILQNIRQLINLREELRKLQDEKKSIGDLQGIESEIKRLNEQIEKLRNEAGFSEEENVIYLKLINQNKVMERKIVKYEQLKESTSLYKKGIISIQSNIINYIEQKIENNIFDKFSKRVILGLSSTDKQEIICLLETITERYQKVLDKIEEKIEFYSMSTSEINKKIEPYKQKISNKELLQKLTSSLNEQNIKLNNINKKTDEIKVIIDNGKKTHQQLFASYSELFNSYISINEELKKEKYRRIADNIELESSLEFNMDKFIDSFINLFDRRGSLKSTFSDCFNDKNEFVFDISRHLENINCIFRVLSSPEKLELKLRAGVNQNQVLERLFDNYFEIKYNIKHKGDDILKMSPGKRGLVLLQLILHISNATHPILIDQPEDNLDNRTIYYELKEFIKEKKTQRQIILVTHNANLVVATDAENVIVSNQSGQQIDKDNKEFRFEYVSGSLESTFKDEEKVGILFKYGIREHVCDVLEGGEEAFIKREQKYGFKL